jgi:membrane protease YdiL (CAAX protease family)
MWILTQLVRRGTAALVSSVLFGFIMLASLAPVAPITHDALNAAVVAVTMVDEDGDGSGTYLRNRVLRI